jgi:GDPmannose 4,6-dehydratase
LAELPLIFHQGDLADTASLRKVLDASAPDEIYNLGAMSNMRASFELAESTGEVNAMGPLRLLEWIRTRSPQTRLFQASTSELFGTVCQSPQTEETPFHPRSPYGVAKLYAHWMGIHYREIYQLYATNGILYNHESPKRGEAFVSRKITRGAARIASGSEQKLLLGNLDAKRDWSYAKDIVEGMWLSLQADQPDDYIFASGKGTSVRTFTELAFREVGIEIEWEGNGIHEKGRNHKTGEILIEISPSFYRPSEELPLIGQPNKAFERLGWKTVTPIEELISLMVQADLTAQEVL